MSSIKFLDGVCAYFVISNCVHYVHFASYHIDLLYSFSCIYIDILSILVDKEVNK